MEVVERDVRIMFLMWLRHDIVGHGKEPIIRRALGKGAEPDQAEWDIIQEKIMSKVKYYRQIIMKMGTVSVMHFNVNHMLMS